MGYCGRTLFFWLCVIAGTAEADFTKIANNGWGLPVSATLGTATLDWACTRDNSSGLVWEVKTSDGGLRDMNKGYTNYDNPNELQKFVSVSTYEYPTLTEINSGNNSIGFINAVNADGLCGGNDWRLPSKDELLGLVLPGSTPTINAAYFPNTPQFFWSGTHGPSDVSKGWYVDFNSGGDFFWYRTFNHRVRLVRTGQPNNFRDFVINFTGSGAGSIAILGVGNFCARIGGATWGNCAGSPPTGSQITLVATAATGSSFTWGGDCISASGPTCTLTLNEAKSVAVDFYRPTPTTAIIVAPNAPATLYAGLDGGGVFKKVGEGSWTSILAGLTNLNVKALAIQSDGTLFAGTDGGGVFKTTDGGANWSACGAMANAAFRSLLVVGGALYAGSTDGVAKSTDNCASWTDFSTGLPAAP